MIKTSDILWQDTQHQVLFDLIDQIKAEPFDREILIRLRRYAEDHFSLEEAYMKQLQFPHEAAHVRAHDQFRKELRQMTEMPLAMSAQLRQSLSLFLEEWLKRHVLGIDKQFERFLLDSDKK